MPKETIPFIYLWPAIFSFMWRLSLDREPALDLTPVTVNGKSYYVDAIFTDGRTASASLKDDRIVIRVPKCVRTAEAEALFLNLKRRISRSLEEHPERFRKHALEFRDGQMLSIYGKYLSITIEHSQSGRKWAKVYDDKVVVKLPDAVYGGSEHSKLVTRLVTRALCRSFRQLVWSRVSELNRANISARIDGITLKDIKSRWGSYSPRSKKISLNVRLLFAPQEVLDYVIVHELCHSRVHNHGKKFWSQVAIILPDYRNQIRWLRMRGDMLGCTEPANASIA